MSERERIQERFLLSTSFVFFFLSNNKGCYIFHPATYHMYESSPMPYVIIPHVTLKTLLLLNCRVGTAQIDRIVVFPDKIAI